MYYSINELPRSMAGTVVLANKAYIFPVGAIVRKNATDAITIRTDRKKWVIPQQMWRSANAIVEVRHG